MLLLIAESKTMAGCGDAVAPADFQCHTPLLEDGADCIMSLLGGMDASELAAATKLSAPMLGRLRSMIAAFRDKSAGGRAIEVFTGVVFKAFAYGALSDEEKKRANGRIRIVSSLYGWLRPDDIVKAYRTDFTMPVAPDGGSLAAYWRGEVTRCLKEQMCRSGCHDILNLLPGDASKCIDWKSLPAGTRVFKADFKEVLPGGTVKTPNSGRLKTLRGELLRQIICEDIRTPEELHTLRGENYMASGTDASGSITFHTA